MPVDEDTNYDSSVGRVARLTGSKTRGSCTGVEVARIWARPFIHLNLFARVRMRGVIPPLPHVVCLMKLRDDSIF
jgi:hypothetical protein